MKKIGLLLFCLAFITPFAVAQDQGGGIWKVDTASSQEIDRHSVCKEVTNNHASGNGLMVPTGTSTEWSTFLANLPGGVTTADCTGGDCPDAVNFDGSTSYELSTSGVSSASDKGTINFWFKTTKTSDSGYIYVSGAHQMRMTIGATGGTEIFAKDASNNLTLRVHDTAPALNDGEWHHYVASWDLSVSDKVYVYIDGSDATSINTFSTGGTIDYSGTVNIGAAGNFTRYIDGDVAQLWFDTDTFIDISDPSNLAKFYNTGTDEAVDLGADGSTPTGSAPDFFFNGAAADFPTNAGTDADLSLDSGTGLTDASTVPPCTSSGGGGTSWYAVTGEETWQSTDDGASWTMVHDAGGAGTYEGLYHYDGTWVAGHSVNDYRYSSDPSSGWTNGSGLANENIRKAVYGNGVWVGVGNDASIYYSSDPTSGWTTGDSGGTYVSGFYVASVCYGDGLFVAPTEDGGIGYSSDGDVWTEATDSLIGNDDMFDCDYGDGYYVIAGEIGEIYYSTDADNWTLVNTGASDHLLAIDYDEDNGLWVAVGDTSVYRASDPAGPWSASSTSFSSVDIMDVQYGNGTWVLSESFGGKIYTSTDADTWTEADTISSGNGIYLWYEGTEPPAVPVDTTPAAFDFSDETDATVSTVTSSTDILQITGIAAEATVSISGSGSPEYRICSDSSCSSVAHTWSSSSGSIANNEYLQLRLTSSGSNGTGLTATIDVGGVTDDWTVTTASSLSVEYVDSATALNTTDSYTSVTTGSFSATGGANNILIAFIHFVGDSTGTADVSTITYGGDAMTEIANVTQSSGDRYGDLAAFYLMDPPSGSNTASITYDNSTRGTIVNLVEYTNVDAANPIAQYDVDNGGGGQTVFNHTLTIGDDGAALVMGTAVQGGPYTFTPGADTTELADGDTGGGLNYNDASAFVGERLGLSTGPNTISATASGNVDAYASIAIELTPGSGGGSGGGTSWYAVTGEETWQSTDDGASWTMVHDAGGAGTYEGLYHYDGTWVAGHSVNDYRYSSDPSSGWTNGSGLANENIRKAVYGNGVWVGVGNDASIYYSSDPTSGWTTGDSGGTYVSGFYVASVCYGDGLFVAPTEDGGIGYSSDGDVWTEATDSLIGNDDMFDCDYGDGYYVIAGEIGEIYYSTDADNWTLVDTGASDHFLAIDYDEDNGLWVAVGDTSVYRASDPAGPWSASSTSFSSVDIMDVQYGNGTWVLSESFGGKIYTSTDADTWTEADTISSGDGIYLWYEGTEPPAAPADTTPDAFDFSDETDATVSTVTSSTDILQISGIDAEATVSISGDGSPAYRICSDSSCSSVAHTWSSSSGSIANNEYLQLRLTSSSSNSTGQTATVDIGGVTDDWTVTTEAAAAVALVLADGNSKNIYTSADGTTWTDTGADITYDPVDVFYKNSVWFISEGVSNILRSTDGTTWSSISVGSNSSDLAYNSGRLISVGGYGRIATSTNDGASWSYVDLGSQNFSGVDYNNGYWLAVSTSNEAYKSTNGTSWSGPYTIPDFAAGRLVYDGSKWVTCRIYCANSSDGESWSLTADPGIVRNLAVQGSLVVAVGDGGEIWTSTNSGSSWTSRLDLGSGIFFDIDYKDGTWFASMTTGEVYSSTNATSWSEVTTSPTFSGSIRIGASD